MTKKQFEELISVLREVKQSLDALKNTPQYVFVTQTPPATHYFGDPVTRPIITCGPTSASVTSKTLGDVQIHQ